MTSKYDRLTEHLRALPDNPREVTLTFKHLESILGFTLPKSAIDYRQWWANPSDSKSHSQARAWTAAGYKVDSVRLKRPGGWVRFVRVGALEDTRAVKTAAETRVKRTQQPEHSQKAASEFRKIDDYMFSKICEIEPEKDDSGKILQFLPQGRYANEGNLPLNKYGTGPFCKFKIPNNHTSSGVYAIVVNGPIKYIGECENLSSRFNMGYGNISPRNCFTGGQDTNCRINNLIFNTASVTTWITLWFIETDEYKRVERRLRSTLAPEWNRI